VGAEITSVGVVGAGVMGSGVAQAVAQTGLPVTLLDVSQSVLDRSRAEIAQNVRLHGLLQRQQPAPDAAEILGHIHFTTDYAQLAGAEFVVENATESWEIKREIYPKLDAICAEPCVFAANTSCISITRLASTTKRPSQVLGIHFMNPVPLKSTMEVIRGHHTSDETLEIAKAFLAHMGKDCIVVNDMPGFVSNRVLMLTVNEAIFVVQDQVAPPEDVDAIFKKCFGHKMGPLETGDLIGLDTILCSLEVLYESYNDSKFRPCPLLKKMVDAGLHGRKSGEGFYRY